MTEQVSVGADFSRLIQQLERSGTALGNFALQSAKVVGATDVLGKAIVKLEDGSIARAESISLLGQKLSLVDSAGRELAATFRTVEGELKLSSVRAVETAKNLEKAKKATLDLAAAESAGDAARRRFTETATVKASVASNVPNAEGLTLKTRADLARVETAVAASFEKSSLALAEFNSILAGVKSGNLDAINRDALELDGTLTRLLGVQAQAVAEAVKLNPKLAEQADIIEALARGTTRLSDAQRSLPEIARRQAEENAARSETLGLLKREFELEARIEAEGNKKDAAGRRLGRRSGVVQELERELELTRSKIKLEDDVLALTDQARSIRKGNIKLVEDETAALQREAVVVAQLNESLANVALARGKLPDDLPINAINRTLGTRTQSGESISGNTGRLQGVRNQFSTTQAGGAVAKGVSKLLDIRSEFAFVQRDTLDLLRQEFELQTKLEAAGRKKGPDGEVRGRRARKKAVDALKEELAILQRKIGLDEKVSTLLEKTSGLRKSNVKTIGDETTALTAEAAQQQRLNELTAQYARQRGELPDDLPINAIDRTAGTKTLAGKSVLGNIENAERVQRDVLERLEAAKNAADVLRRLAAERARLGRSGPAGALIPPSQPDFAPIPGQAGRPIADNLSRLRDVRGEFAAAQSAFVAGGQGDPGRRLAASLEAAEAASKSAKAGLDSLLGSVKGLARTAGIAIFVGALFEIQSAFRAAITESAQLSIKIAQIQTISRSAGLATREWATELQKLSGEFGTSSTDQATAAYQTFSRQLKGVSGEAINAQEAIGFLRVANKLAAASVSDTSVATDALTSVLNAYKLNVGDAERVSNQLFKTVELGRSTLPELADGIGRVAVPAAQLGIEFSELAAGIATITNQGVNASEAYTLLGGIFQKAIKPTDAMQAALQKLGFASGDVLFKQKGLLGSLVALQEVAGDTVPELAELFNRIRALRGVLSLTGASADDFAGAFARIKAAGQELNAVNVAAALVLESTGKRIDRATQTIKNAFERNVGLPVSEALAKALESFQNVETFSLRLTQAILTLGIVATGFAVGAAAKMIVALHAIAVASGVAATSVAALTVGLLALSGLGVILIAISDGIRRASAEELKALEEQAGAVAKNRAEVIKNVEAGNKRQLELVNERIDASGKAAVEESAEAVRFANQTRDAISKSLSSTEALYKKSLNAVETLSGKLVSKSTTSLSKLTDKVKRAVEEAAAVIAKTSDTRFKIDLEFSGTGQDVRLIERELKDARERLAAARESGDTQAFTRERGRIDQLLDERASAEVSFNTQRSSLDENYRRAKSAGERAAAKEQLRILDEGTQAQLDGLKTIDAARKAVAEAKSPEARNEALKNLAETISSQERLNKLAEENKKIQETANAERLATLKEVARFEADQRKLAEAERARLAKLEQQKFTFDVLRKESDDFKIDEKSKDPSAIAKSTREELARIEKLRSLSADIGGGKDVDELLLSRAQKIREDGLAKIIAIQETAFQEEQAKRIAAAKKIAEAEAEAGANRIKRDIAVLLAVVQKFEKDTPSFAPALEAAPPGQGLEKVFSPKLVDTPRFGTGDLEAESKAVTARFEELQLASRKLYEILNEPVQVTGDISKLDTDAAQKQAAVVRQLVRGLTIDNPNFRLIDRADQGISQAFVDGSSFGDPSKRLSTEQNALLDATIPLLKLSDALPKLLGELGALGSDRLDFENATRDIKLFDLGPIPSAAKTFGQTVAEELKSAAPEIGKKTAEGQRAATEAAKSRAEGPTSTKRVPIPQPEPRLLQRVIKLGAGAESVAVQMARFARDAENFGAELRKETAERDANPTVTAISRNVTATETVAQAVERTNEILTSRSILDFARTGGSQLGSAGDAEARLHFDRQLEAVNSRSNTSFSALPGVRVSPRPLVDQQSPALSPGNTTVNVTIEGVTDLNLTAEKVFAAFRRATRLGR